nr:chitinase [Cryptococcus tetragattii IND107]
MAHPPKPAKQPSANKKPASIPTFAVLTVLLLAAIAFLFPQTDSRFPSHPWKTVGKLLKGSEVEMNNPKRTVGYFIPRGIYDRKFPPQKIPSQHLTHINYAFGNVKKDSGEVVLSDTWADVEIHYEGDSWDEPGTNLYGCFKAIYLMKKQNRNLKVLLSIGGWSFSPIDYEYPKTPRDAEAYVALLRELRQGLEQLAQSKGKPQGQYQLTVAAPCGWEQMQVLRVREMDQVLDFWNLMAYDFAGSWDSVAGHQANLYSDKPDGQSVDRSVRFYLEAGVHPTKLVVGLPVYGRSFAHTKGIGFPFSGTGEGSWEAGMWDYKALPQPGAQETNDHRLGASYSYDPAKRLLITYDTQAIAHQKASYIAYHGLGGAMWWELDADKPEETGQALVRTVRDALGQLEWRENELDYPGSKYDNLRRRME